MVSLFCWSYGFCILNQCLSVKYKSRITCKTLCLCTYGFTGKSMCLCMYFCNSAPEPHLHSVAIYFSKRPGTVFCAWVPFVLDCRVLQARFRQQNFTARFSSPDSGSPTPAESLSLSFTLHLSPSLSLSLPLFHLSLPLSSSLRSLASLTGASSATSY